MATRRDAREWAVQILFQLDLNPSDSLNEVLLDFWKLKRSLLAEQEDEQVEEENGLFVPGWQARIAQPRILDFTEKLVRGVREHITALDARIAECAANWDLHRMGGIDRNVMRMALYEVFYDRDAPTAVCINEAVDIAKYYAHRESGRFVNGILDRACRDAPPPKPKQGRD